MKFFALLAVCLTLALTSTEVFAQTPWPYDPSLQPITRQEMMRILGNAESTPKEHQRLLARAGMSGLLEYTVMEYDKARKKRPQDPVLQSAFGLAFFRETSILYKPSNKALRDQQKKKLFTRRSCLRKRWMLCKQA